MNPITHPLTLRRRALLAAALLAALPAVGLPLAARASAVTDWSLIATSTPAGAPPQRSRIETMASLAIHDALNTIDPRYERYGVVPAAKPGASPDAAIATAAYRVLSDTLPAQAAALKTQYDNYVAALPGCAPAFPNCIADGVEVGGNAAQAILALRLNDGSATPDLPYAAPLLPGVYQPTPGPAPRFEGWALVRPFVMRSADQFRAGDSAVMHLDSDTYARDYNEVKSIGDALVRGAASDSAQSNIARFWAGGGADWNTVVRNILAGLGLDRWQEARLFALVNASVADAGVSVFDTKYHYRFWRPITAIRWMQGDGNPATTANPDWTPFLATPPYPDYVCGLPIATGAATEAIRRYFGTDAVGWAMTVNAAAVAMPNGLPALPAKSITRTYTSLSGAAAEAADARVYAGIHFRTGCKQGLTQGRQVGRFVFQHALKPLK